MRKSIYFLAIFFMGLSMVFITSHVSFAQGGEKVNKDAPACGSLLNAQAFSQNDIESRCAVPAVRDVNQEIRHPFNKKYNNSTLSASGSPVRYGRVARSQVESWSDLAEDQIKVDGMYYSKLPQNTIWNFRSHCKHDGQWSRHVACRTDVTPGSGWDHKQKGYHYFHTSGFVDTNFSTELEWSS